MKTKIYSGFTLFGFRAAGLTAIFVLVCFSGICFGAKYKPGTYRGEDSGYSSKREPGKIAVEVTVDENSITNISIVTFEQKKKGRQGRRNEQAMKIIVPAILKKQSFKVDSIAKASASSVGIELAVAHALEQATVAYRDGVYKGSARGFNKSKLRPGKIDVQVVVEDGKIAKIDLLTFKQTGIGRQAKRNKQAREVVPASIVKSQSITVDRVAKASFASNGIKLAVARALEQAR